MEYFIRTLTGRFLLDARLPITINDHSEMEVDFLCAPARPVIELDGLRHITDPATDPATDRRDRRKDALLQLHGYFILCFLTDDPGKNPEHLLDHILRLLAHNQR